MNTRPSSDKHESGAETAKIEGIPLVPEPSRDCLTERQQLDYAHHRREFLRWSLNIGKSPDKSAGYSRETMAVRASRTDMFYRWVWNQRGYTTGVSHEDADSSIQEIVYSDRLSPRKRVFSRLSRDCLSRRSTSTRWNHWTHTEHVFIPTAAYSTTSVTVSSSSTISETSSPSTTCVMRARNGSVSSTS